ncbi:MAG: deoxyribodipyrimidine photo-lyase [Alphaproteobacteria bacterium]|nr:deoxyribodipyrimidine photo-lyase [Alphaproteobacteria bacterium]
MSTRLVWLRRDLRIADNPALSAAHAAGGPPILLYVLDPEGEGCGAPGAAARWWLHGSLAALASEVARRGGTLLHRRGPAERIVPEIAREAGAACVHWNAVAEPDARRTEERVAGALGRLGIASEIGSADTLYAPGSVLAKAGTPFQVFTAFWRAARASGLPEAPLAAPACLAAPAGLAQGETLDSLALLPRRPDWAAGLRTAWTPGEAPARARLARFLDEADRYAAERDRPAAEAGSRLSPHLRFGEISVRTVFHAVHGAMAEGRLAREPAERFLAELGWRDFARHLLTAFPSLGDAPLKSAFAAFPWREDRAGLEAWRRGRTGYPIVDAGMRELWRTGFMHNRVRMIAASFLVKHLLVNWREGAAWFLDTLVDADLASNAINWQWVAGCGTDAAPYFRIFNPVLQGEKLDGEGTYVRRWVPELTRLPARWVHRPFEADPELLAGCGVRLGETYPLPLVEHRAARERALAAFARVKAG